MWALINSNIVTELTEINPTGRFHPSMIWVPCTEGVQVGWQYSDGVFSPQPALQLNVQRLKETVTQRRWEVETGGITLSSGIHVETGVDDQNRITSVIANARLANLDTVSFKAASGWITLALAELEGVAAAIAMHVQACFSAERTHHEALDALELLHADDNQALQQALEAYDLEQGWPATDLQTPQPA